MIQSKYCLNNTPSENNLKAQVTVATKKSTDKPLIDNFKVISQNESSYKEENSLASVFDKV